MAGIGSGVDRQNIINALTRRKKGMPGVGRIGGGVGPVSSREPKAGINPPGHPVSMKTPKPGYVPYQGTNPYGRSHQSMPKKRGIGAHSMLTGMHTLVRRNGR